MSTKKKANKGKFLVVVLGLFTIIGLIVGGTYVLNEQGLISAGNMPEGGEARPEGPPPGFEADGETTTRPERDEAGMAFNSQAVVGLFKVMLQISIVIVIVAGGQWLFSWLRRRRHLHIHNQFSNSS